MDSCAPALVQAQSAEQCSRQSTTSQTRRRCAPGSTRRWRPRCPHELYKAQNIVRQFAQVGALYPERSIPAAVLDGAAGFAVLSVVKVKRLWTD